MYKIILLPIDLNAESSWQKALPTALDLARVYSAKLHVVAVVPNLGTALVGSFFPKDFEKEAMDAAQAELAKFERNLPDDVATETHLAHGTIYEEIIHAADTLGADLIVMASHRPELKDYLLGPNAARVVRHAKQSVVVVRD